MTLVYVQHRTICVHDERGEGPYVEWSSDNVFNVDGVVLNPSYRWGYDAIQIAPNVRDGDTVWVLWYVYNSGDSLGSETGQGEILWVFADENIANTALVTLQANGGEVPGFVFADEDGEELHLSNPVAGDYFCKIEGFCLQRFVVGQCPQSSY